VVLARVGATQSIMLEETIVPTVGSESVNLHETWREDDAGDRFSPKTRTLVPPAIGPDGGKICEMEGTGTYVNVKKEGSYCFPLPERARVTMEDIVLVYAEGDAHVTVVELTKEAFDTVSPNLQNKVDVAGKLFPVSVTTVPPDVGPLSGETSSI
jgi:hypothetical protein